MKTQIKAWIEKNDRKWVVAAVVLNKNEIWSLDNGPGARPHTDDPSNFDDTSDHVGLYLSGEYQVHHPGNQPINISGIAKGSAETITGDKRKYPNKPFTVRCITPGEILFVIPKGESKPDIEYEILLPTESVTVPTSGWAMVMEGDAYTSIETISGVVNALSDSAPTLVFWEK